MTQEEVVLSLLTGFPGFYGVRCPTGEVAMWQLTKHVSVLDTVV